MKLFSPLMAVALAGLLVSPLSANVLTNGSFELGNYSSWTPVNNANFPNNPDVHGPGWFFGAGPSDGSYAAGAASNWGQTRVRMNQNVPYDSAGQDVILTLTFTAWVYDNGGAASYIQGDIRADTNIVATIQHDSNSTQEQHMPLTISWQGPVTSQVGVRMTAYGDGQTNGWGVASLDNVVLTITPVPEPATMALLGLGALPLIRRRR